MHTRCTWEQHIILPVCQQFEGHDFPQVNIRCQKKWPNNTNQPANPTVSISFAAHIIYISILWPWNPPRLRQVLLLLLLWRLHGLLKRINAILQRRHSSAPPGARNSASRDRWNENHVGKSMILSELSLLYMHYRYNMLEWYHHNHCHLVLYIQSHAWLLLGFIC